MQGILEDALGTVLRIDPAPRLTVAGRTDAGVHAQGQVAHVDVPLLLGQVAPVDVSRVPGQVAPVGVPRVLDARRLNALLPPDVRIRAVRVASEGFDARFAAMSRSYVYRVADGVPDPLRRHDTLAWRRPLDVEAMHAAAQALLGLRDFAAFCRRRATGTTVRTLLRLDVARNGTLVALDVEADAFCHSMVRSLVGGLLAVGEGRRPAEWLLDVLRSGERMSYVAPPHGLTLMGVRYPPDAELAGRTMVTRRPRDPRDALDT